MILSRLLSSALLRRQLPALKIILGVKLALLIANAALTIHLGPFSNGDDEPAVLTGMVLIAAMAIQNAAHRIHLGSAPPSTLMTGTCVTSGTALRVGSLPTTLGIHVEAVDPVHILAGFCIVGYSSRSDVFLQLTHFAIRQML